MTDHLKPVRAEHARARETQVYHPIPLARRAELLTRRAIAYAIDIALVWAWIALLATLSLGTGFHRSDLFSSPWSAHAIGFLSLTLPVWFAMAALERSGWMATPGKRAMGLVVVTAGFERLSWLSSLGRTGMKLVPWEIAHAVLWRAPVGDVWGPEHDDLTIGLLAVCLVLGSYCVCVLLSPRGASLHDLVTGTRVIWSLRASR